MIPTPSFDASLGSIVQPMVGREVECVDAHSANHDSLLLLFDKKSVLFFTLVVVMCITHTVNVAGHARHNKEECNQAYQPCERMHNHLWRKEGPVNVVVR